MFPTMTTYYLILEYDLKTKYPSINDHLSKRKKWLKAEVDHGCHWICFQKNISAQSTTKSAPWYGKFYTLVIHVQLTFNTTIKFHNFNLNVKIYYLFICNLYKMKTLHTNSTICALRFTTLIMQTESSDLRLFHLHTLQNAHVINKHSKRSTPA